MAPPTETPTPRPQSDPNASGPSSSNADFRTELAAAGLQVTTQVRLWTASDRSRDDARSSLRGAGLPAVADDTGSTMLYETRVAEGHSHVVCRSCGSNADVWFGDLHATAPPALDPASVGGFLIDEAEVTFWGTCPACQEQNGADHVNGGQRLTVLACPAPPVVDHDII